MLNSKVQSVEKNKVTVAGPGGSTVDIPFGACVWATGVAMSPLVKQLQVACDDLFPALRLGHCCLSASLQPNCHGKGKSAAA